MQKLLKQILSIQISIYLVFAPVLSAADLEIDGTTSTTLDTSRNGVPIVNIANPNSTGLSHNKFNNYNVNSNGLILNNSNTQETITQLGGIIYGNTNLNTNAKVILNEVTSTNRSFINGATEIAGQKADLVIANPNGLNINGAGFINTSNITLTTGKVNIINNQISSYSIQGGDINIQSSGLDTSNLDNTDIYTHYLKLNGAINAKKLNIKLGLNQIDALSKNIRSSSNSNTSNLLLDSSALGGMYANAIFFEGTDKGLGVNLPPEVLASSGEIVIDNDGNIVLNKLSSPQNITITSKNNDIELNNNIYTSKILKLSAKNELNIYNGQIAAKEQIHLDAINITNSGTIIAGLNENQSLNTNAILNITSTNLTNNNSISSTKTLNITNINTIINNQQINSNDSLDINSTNLVNNSLINSNNSLNLNITNITNESNITSNNTLNINSNIVNNNNGYIQSQTININSNDINNNANIISNNLDLNLSNNLSNNGYIEANETFIIKSTNIDNNGSIYALNNLDINSTNLTNHKDIISSNNLILNINETLINKGKLQALNEINISSNNLYNTKLIHSDSNINIISLNDINNSSLINANNNLSLNANTINNERNLTSLNNLDINTTNLNSLNANISSSYININSQDINNTNSNILASKDINITNENYFFNSGVIQANDDLNITSKDLVNNKELLANNININNTNDINNTNKIFANNSITLNSMNLNNDNNITSNNIININANTINNNTQANILSNKIILISHNVKNDALIKADDNLSITNLDTINNNGTLQAVNSLNIITNNLTNTKNIDTNDTLILNVMNALNNQGVIHSNNYQKISTQTLNNDANISAVNTLDINTSTLNNTNANIIANNIIINSSDINNSTSDIIVINDITIVNTNDIYNNGYIQSKTLNINTNTMTNNDSILSNNANIIASSLNNKGMIYTNNINDLNITNTLNNTGLIESNNTLNISANNLINDYILEAKDINLSITNDISNNAIINASNNLYLQSNSLSNEYNITALNIDINSSTINNNWLIQSQNDTIINSSNLINDKYILSNNKLIINTNDLTNNEEIYSNNTLNIDVINTLNNNKNISTLNDANISANTFNTTNGEISANNLLIDSNTLNNTNTNILALNDMTMNISTKLTNNGNIQASNDLNISTNELDNQSSKNIIANNIIIDALTLTNSGSILSTNNLEVKNASNITNNDLLQASNELKLQSVNLTNNKTITAGQNLIVDISNNIYNNTSNSKLNSLGNINIDAKNLYNQNAKILGQNQINIDITNDINNQDAIIQSLVSNAIINSKYINNQNANIEAKETLSINTNTISTTTSSKIYAKNTNLTLNSQGLTNDFILEASNNLNLNINGNLNIVKDILANGDLTINTRANDLTNNNTRTISSGRNLDISSGTLTNNSTISAGSGTFHLNIDGNIVNNSRISSKGNLIVSGIDITNNAQINSANDLTINSTNLTNNQTLFAGNDMNLYTTSTLRNNEDANIFAYRNLKLAKNSSNAKTALIENISASIGTYTGDINLYASTFNNMTNGDVVVGTRETDDSESITLYLAHDREGWGNKAIGYSERFRSIFTEVKDFDLDLKKYDSTLKQELINEDKHYYEAKVYKAIHGINHGKYCLGDYGWPTKCFTRSELISEPIYYEEEEFDEDNPWYSHYKIKFKDEQYSNYGTIEFNQNDVVDKLTKRYKNFNFDITVATSSATDQCDDCDGYSVTKDFFLINLGNTKYSKVKKTIDQTEDYIISEPSNKASISSAGNLNFKVDNLKNDLSIISAQNNIDFDVSGLLNNRAIELKTHTTLKNEYYTDFNWHNSPATVLPSTLNETYFSTIQAGGSITGNVEKLENGAIKENEDLPSSTRLDEDTSTKQSSQSQSAQSMSLADVSNDINNKDTVNIDSKQSINGLEFSLVSKDTNIVAKNMQKNTKQENQIIINGKTISLSTPISQLHTLENLDKTIKIPQSEFGLFISSKAPKSKYLIETNPQFTLKANFVSSKYMLDKIGFSPEVHIKKLGDALYEQKVIQDQIFVQTGRAFLSPQIKSNQDQFQYLMDNAVIAQQDLELSPGISLSKEQINALTTDIVWMEEKIINGQIVLAPQVYIANPDNFIIQGGQIIAGESINLKVKDLLNSGNFEAGKNLNIDASNTIVNNGGTIQAKEDMTLVSINDITNISGSIKANNINIESKQGSIVNKTFSKEVDFSKGVHTYKDTLIGKIASISSRNGNLILNAKKNILNKGADLSAKGGNLALITKEGDVKISTLKKQNKYGLTNGRSFYKKETIKHIQSNLDASDGSIVIQSGNDIQLESVNLNAKNTIALNSVKNIDITAVNDVDYTDIQTYSKKSFGRSKTTRNMTYKEEVKSSNLNSSNIVMNSKNKDINLIGTNLNAKENIIANASNGDINVIAQQYKTGSLQYTKKKGFAGLSSSSSTNAFENLDLKSSELTISKDDLKNTASNESIQSIKQDIQDTVGTSINSTYLDNKKEGISFDTNNLNVLASNVNAGDKDLNAKIHESVNILSQEEIKKTKNVKESQSFSIVNAAIGIASGRLVKTGAIYELHEDKNTKTSKIHKSSSFTGNNINIDAGDITIKGSDVLATNDVNVKTDVGDINILNAINTYDEVNVKKDIEIKIGNIGDMVKSLVKQVKSNDARAKVEIASATYDATQQKQKTTKVLQSNITSKNKNISLDSAGSIQITSSNLNSQNGTTTLNAQDGDIAINEAQELMSKIKKQTHGSAKVSLSVTNEYAQIAVAAKALKDAKKGVSKAKQQMRKYQKDLQRLEQRQITLKQELKNNVNGVSIEDIEDMNEILEDMKSDKKLYDLAIATSVFNVASKTTALIKQTATAAANSGTFGFTGGITLDVKGNKKQTNTKSTTSIASNINTKNLIIKTKDDKDTTIQGSNINVSNDASINTNNLNLQASKNTTSNDMNNKSINGSVTMGMGGLSASIGKGKDKENSSTLSNINSKLNIGNNLTLNISNDLNIKGANVIVQNQTNANIANDLNIVSLRDIKKESSSSSSIGMSGGANGLSGANASMSSNKSTKKTVVESSFISNTAKINVQGNTHLEGSTLATGTYDKNNKFIQNKNLHLITNTLSTKNLSNVTYEKGNSMALSVSLASKTNKDKDAKVIKNKDGTAQTSKTLNNLNANYKKDLTYNKTKTLATLGLGNISIKNTKQSKNLDDINRDVNNNIKEIFNVNNKLDVKADVDARLFSKDGRNEIKKDVLDTKNHGQEIYQAGKDVANNKELGFTDFFKNVNKYATDRKIAAKKATNKNTQDKLKGEKGAQASKEEIQALSNELSKKDGLDTNTNILLYDGEKTPDDIQVNSQNDFNKELSNAGYEEKTNSVIINIDKTDMTNSKEVVRATLHEQERHTQSQNNNNYSDDTSTNLAKARGDRVATVWDDYSDLAGISTTSKTNIQTSWNKSNENSATILKGNSKVKKMKSIDVKPWASQKGFYVHQDAIEESLKGKITKKEFKILNKAQVYADGEEYQKATYSFRHAMRNADTKQKKDEALKLANKFVRKQFEKAWNATTEEEALFEFGVALHTIQDSTSPSHTGFQEWSNNENKSYITTKIKEIKHVKQELINPGKGSKLYESTETAWKWFKNKKLPENNLFNFGHD